MRQSKQSFIFSIKGFGLLIGFLFTCSILHAQGPGGEGEGDPDLVPIDGGLVFLLAAGVGYGVKKARDSKEDCSK